MKYVIYILGLILITITFLLLTNTAGAETSPYPGYPYKVDVGTQYCWMSMEEWNNIKADKYNHLKGRTTYRVIEGARCKNK